MDQRKFDLEGRLVDYTCEMLDAVDALQDNYIAGQ